MNQLFLEHFGMFLLVLTAGISSQMKASTLTCVDQGPSAPAQWSVSHSGRVSTGFFTISQLMTSVSAQLQESGETKLIELNRFQGSPFQGCNGPESFPLETQSATLFECGLHGYGRGYFYPSGLYCHNNDRSSIRIIYDSSNELVTWQFAYPFGSCFENGKKLYLTGEAKLEKTFKKNECRYRD